MKRFIILTLFLIGNAINGFLYADTLDNYLFSQEDDSIKTLYQLCIKYNGDISVFGCLDRLQSEAVKKKNKKLNAVAMGLRIQAFVNQNMIDSVLKYEKPVVDALRKEEEYRRMFIVQNLVIEKLISNQRYADALTRINEQYEEAKKLQNTVGLAMACKNFGQIYQYTGRPAEASRFYQEALQLLEESENISLMIDLYLDIILTDREQGKFSEALENCNKCFVLLKKTEDTSQNRNKDDALLGRYFTCYCLKAFICLELDQPEEAKRCIDNAISWQDSLWSGAWLYPLWDVQIKYYLYIKDYEEALKYYKIRLEKSSQVEQKVRLCITLDKARIDAGMGKYVDACKMYEEHISLNDSLFSLSLAKQLDEVRALYEIDKLEIKAEKDRLKIFSMSIGIVVLIVICLLLGIITSIIRRNARNLKQKNRSLYLQLKERDALQAEIKRLSSNKAGTEKETNATLFSRLEEWMGANNAYVNPQITIKEVAAALSTNTRYLSEAIRNETQQTFNDYVNTLRLEQACRLILSDKFSQMTIEGIAVESGFSTRSNFYRLFRSKYGLTPSELKKQDEEEKHFRTE